MNSKYNDHERIVMQIAKELESDGYVVILNPKPEQIPFSLAGYNPDILASKGNDNRIVEIKMRESPENLPKLREVIKIVERHPGWRFLIKSVARTVNPIEEPVELIPIDSIEYYLKKVNTAIDAGLGELAIIYLWNITISILRNKAALSGLRAELSDRSIVNQLYTMGVISNLDYKNLKDWNTLRNTAVHSVAIKIPQDSICSFLNYTQSLFDSSKLECPPKGELPALFNSTQQPQ